MQTDRTSGLRSTPADDSDDDSSMKPRGTGSILPPRASACVVEESLANERARIPRPSYLPAGAEAFRDRMDVFSESELDDDNRDKDYYPSRGSREVREESCPDSESGKEQQLDSVSRPASAQMRGQSGQVARRRRLPQPRLHVRYLVAQFFTSKNIRRHLRSSVHGFPEQQINSVLLKNAPVRGRATLRCSLLGEARADGKICKTMGSKRLNQHLSSWHGILHNTERLTDLLTQAKTRLSTLENMTEAHI